MFPCFDPCFPLVQFSVLHTDAFREALLSACLGVESSCQWSRRNLPSPLCWHQSQDQALQT